MNFIDLKKYQKFSDSNAMKLENNGKTNRSQNQALSFWKLIYVTPKLVFWEQYKITQRSMYIYTLLYIYDR